MTEEIVMIDKNIRKNYDILLAPFITAVVLLVCFAIGKIYPFGSNNVEYYDMAQGIIPNFYHVWDALHTKDISLWFNWYSGLGVNDTANASLSVFWIALLVLPRRLVGKAMGLYVVMTFSLSAFTSSIFLKKATGTKPFVTILLSLCYAFCGFSVMYYTNAWQDTVLLFPLFMLAWYALMKKSKILPYIIMVVLNVLCGYYVFILLIFYVFFMSFLYLKTVVDKKRRKRCAFELGLSTAFGFGLSGAILLPKLAQTFSSERFLSETGFDFSRIVKQYLDIAQTTVCKSDDKWAMLFCVSLPLAMMILGIIENRKNKKTNIFFVLNILLLAVLIVCEGANALMHFGDYKYFPMRMGYALAFSFVWAAGYYSKFLKFNKLNFEEKSGKNILLVLFNFVLFFCLMFLTYFVLKKFDNNYEFKYSVLYSMPILTALYFVVFYKKNKIVDYRVALSIVLAETLALSTIFIPYWQTDMLEKEHNPQYISTSQSLVKKLGIESSKIDRIKTVGTTLNCNYGTIMQRATLADWTHLIPSNIQSSLISLGYSSEYTRLHDSGGTAFTDAILGVKNVLSVKNESSELYNKISKKKGYNYYKCKYTLPYAMAVNKSILDIDTQNSNWIDLNNQLYKSFTETNENIVENGNLTLKSKSNNTEIYTFDSKKGNISYFKLDGAVGVSVYVDGEVLKIPSIDREKAKKYPGRFNRNLICLGDLGDKEVEIKLEFKEGKCENKKNFRKNNFGNDDIRNKNFGVEIGLMSLEKLQKVCDMYNYKSNVKAENYSLSASINANNEQKILLLPLQYNGCWIAKVNGKNEQVKSVLGLLSAVELDKGENNVSLHFAPTGLKAGLMISGVSVLIFALAIILRKKNKLMPNAFCGFVYSFYFILFAIASVLVYVFPTMYLIFHSFLK